MKELIARSTIQFRQKFQTSPQVVGIAPGRLEILGNHTDYNGGYILSVSVDRATAVSLRPRQDPEAQVWSEVVGKTASFLVTDEEKVAGQPWADYVKGVVVELRRSKVDVPGFNAAIVSDVPLGAGLSSSAALEVATAMAIRAIRAYKMPPMDLAKLCRRAENDFVGMGCGILDQFSAIYGSKNAFLFLDCLKLAPQVVDTDADWATLVVCESTAPRELVEGKYDTRRKECFSAAKKLGKALGRRVRYLREVSVEEFQTHGGKALAPNEWKRANHVIRENARVLEGLQAVRKGDVADLGRLMLESHASSRDYFENSCPELDTLIEVAEEAPGFVGGKLCGGGFGGATVNLVREDQADVFQAKVRKGYADRYGKEPQTILCRIGHGARFAKVEG